MGKIAIGWSDWGDAASLELIGNEPASGAVAANLQAMQPRDVWESTSLLNLHFELDRGSAERWNAIALLFTNATAAATWRVRAADDQASLTDGTADYDSGSVTLRAAGADDSWDRTHGLIWEGNGVTRRWLRIDITDAANPDGVFRAGRLVVGDLWQPARNAQYPRAFGHRDDTSHQRTDGGPLHPTVRGDPYLSADLRLDYMSEDDALAEAYELRRQRGRRKDVLVLLDPEESAYLHQMILYGLVTRDETPVHRGFKRYQHRLELSELI